MQFEGAFFRKKRDELFGKALDFEVDPSFVEDQKPDDHGSGKQGEKNGLSEPVGLHIRGDERVCTKEHRHIQFSQHVYSKTSGESSFLIRYFDSHAHLSDPLLFPEISSLIARARAAGVQKILNICTNPEELERGILLAQEFPEVFPVGATPPHTAEEEGEKDFSFFAKAARAREIVAIGETGLDFYNATAPKEVQIPLLIRYLHLAQETRLPLIFHCRNAFSDLFEVVDRDYQGKGPVVLHCFTGTWEEAQAVLERGWLLSLSGIVTFKKSLELQEIAKRVPLEQLLIETDAPFLAPQSQRGKRNEPAFVPEVAEWIARLKGIAVEVVAEATFLNATRLLT